MKSLIALLSLVSASMIACTHSITSDADFHGPTLPAPSNKAAAGTLNGKAEQFAVGTFYRASDQSGAPFISITLNGDGTQSCNTATDNVNINVPAAAGTYNYPKANVMFGTVKTDGTAAYDVSLNSEVIITSINGGTITGSIRSSAGNSMVSGTFMASECQINSSPTRPTNPPPTQAQPAPAGDPSTVAAVVATNWSDVHYAFCSAQGQTAVLIDFGGANLSGGASNAPVSIGMRSCDGSQPFAFSSATMNLSVTGNAYEFNFGPSRVGVDNTIEVGPTSFTNGYGVFGGNSGPCTFLVNKATQGVYDQDPNFSCK